MKPSTRINNAAYGPSGQKAGSITVKPEIQFLSIILKE
jgi:hypothetical protein